MARPWCATVVAVLATLSSVSACDVTRDVTHGDPVHTIGVLNDSAAPVIVRFASFDQAFLVRPGGGGIAAQGFGYLDGPIDVLDAACHVMQSVVVTAQRAVVVIAADGVARLDETDDMPTGNLSRTDQCAG